MIGDPAHWDCMAVLWVVAYDSLPPRTILHLRDAGSLLSEPEAHMTWLRRSQSSAWLLSRNRLDASSDGEAVDEHSEPESTR